MTESVVTADCSASLREVGELMRDRNVGSVVICEHGLPAGLITDRDLALIGVADGVDPAEPVREHATRPLVTAESEMDIEDAILSSQNGDETFELEVDVKRVLLTLDKAIGDGGDGEGCE